MLTKATYSMIEGAPFNVLDYGADNTGVADSAAAIQAAITAASQAVGGAIGAVVYFPTGTYLIGQTIELPNRVGLQGANGRGVEIKPHSSFADSYMFHAVNGTSSMFGSWIRDMLIDARGKNMTAVVWSQAWQETCGMQRVTIIFDGTTNYGFYYTDGFGGAAYLPLSDCEIFSDSTFATAAGVRVDQISLTGAFVLNWDSGTIAGTVTNPLPIGINMENDSLIAKTLHCEYVDSMATMKGVGALSADMWTGSFNPVVDMATLAATFSGTVSLRNMLPNGASGNIVTDNTPTALNITAASTGILPSYARDFSGFSAYVDAQIPNVTGNNTEYSIVFNNQIYDYKNEYNPATGIFTAKRAGKYLLSASVKIAVTTSVTTYVIKISTPNREYVLFRGDTDNIRSGDNTITLNGSVIADMDALDTARVNIIVNGLGADTVDVEADETFFQCQWLTR